MASKIEGKLDQLIDLTSRLDERQKNMAKDTEMIPVMAEKLNKHDLTLYGSDGKNGLVGNNKLLMKAFWGAQAIIVTGGTALSMFKDQVMDFLLNKGVK